MPQRFSFAILLIVALLAAPARGADLVADTLKLIPPDSAICLVVRDLRPRLDRILESPLFESIKSDQFAKALKDKAQFDRARDILKLLADQMTEQLGVSPKEIRDDVFGDAIVFAYRAGPSGKADEESGILIVRPRKPEVMAKLIEGLNNWQKKTGEVEAINEKKLGELKYFERDHGESKKEYYYLHENVFVSSGQESAIREVIERESKLKELKAGPLALGIESLGLRDKGLIMAFEPRRFDKDLKSLIAGAPTDQARSALRQFSRVWDAVDCAAIFAETDRDLEIGIVAAFKLERLPPEARQLLFPRSGGSALWACVPDDAVLAVGGRIDIPRIREFVESFLEDNAKKSLNAAFEEHLSPIVGRKRLGATLAGIGPDWIFWASDSGRRDAWFPKWTFAVKLSKEQAVGFDLEKTVLQTVDTITQFLRIEHNKKNSEQVDLDESTKNGVSVKYFTGASVFPEGFHPAYGVKDGYFVVGNDSESVFRFTAPKAKKTDSFPSLRLSAKSLRAYLDSHGKELSLLLAKRNGIEQEEAEGKLEIAASLLKLFDKVELAYVADENVARMTLRVEFCKPLRK